ncbi:MAG TPA: PAS domain S-box protein [Thermotogota bacterium]|nr:PAS domain S-box protein [Thermotogota bacterium]
MKEFTDDYKGILEGSVVGTWVWNIQTGEMDLNEIWTKILGYRSGIFNPVTCEQWDSLIHPDDLNKRKEGLKEYFLGEKNLYECELRMKHQNGDWIWIAERGSVLQKSVDGQPLMMSAIFMDITDRKQAEQNLSQNGEHFKKLFQNSRDGMYIRSSEGYIEEVNDSFLKIHGFDRDEVIGKKSWEFIHPESLAYIEEMKQKGQWENYISEVRIVTKTGDKRYVEISTFTLDSSTENTKIAGTIRDVTELRASEKKMALMNSRLQLAMDAGEHGFWDWDILKNNMYFSPGYYKMLGYEYGEFPMTIESWELLIHPEDKKLIVPKIFDYLKEAKPFSLEFRLKCKDGHYKWISGQGKAFEKDVNGNPCRAVGVHVDIDNVKKAEESQRLLLDNINTQVWYLLDECTYGAVNKAHADFLGKSKEEIAYKNMYELLPESVAEQCRQNNRKVFTQKITVENEEWAPNDSGENRLLSVIKSPKLNDDGQVEYVVCSAIDITDQKRAEERLKTSEKNFNHFFQSMDDLIFVGTIEGQILFINQAVMDKLGYDHDELIKMHILDVHPTDRRTEAERIFAEMFRGERETCPLPLQKKNGELLPVETKVWFGKWNEKEVIYGISKDLSKQQAALDKFTKLFESNPALMSLSSLKDKRILDVNRSFVETLGYEKHEVLGSTSEELALFVDPEKHKLLAELLMRTGRIREKEVQVKTKSGKTLTGLVSGEVIDNQYEKIYLSVMTDITKQKEAEEKAKEASRAKSEFLANMSHEIRTPLNGIIGFSELLQRSNLTEKQQEYMQAVKNSADSLMDIINDILDFSKIEAGKMELNHEKTDIVQLCENIIDIVKFRAQDKGLELLLDLKNNVPKYAWIDALRLKQVLVNLLGNAIKFTEEGQVELKVIQNKAYQEGDEQMASIIFMVEDTGIGIGEKNRTRIFEAFSQEDLSTTKKFGGSGLGLAISNRLLKMMDSQLLLKSELGKGSTFYFTLSLKVHDQEEQKEVWPEEIRTILLIDDNEDSRKIIRENLEFIGATVTEARNGFEGLEVLTKQRDFDLMIIDYHMPYMNGIEVIQTVREKFELTPNELPIILLHSSSENEAIQAGCQKYKVAANILKPIKMSRFIPILSGIKNPKTSDPSVEQNKEKTIARNFSKESAFKNILIAEDNTTNMLFVKTTISQLLPQARIIEATNGEEAVQLTREEEVDLIFMDVRMPKMDGYEATKAIREFNTTTMIIALTAGVITGERERCLQAGMNDYLAKPVTIDAIERVLFDQLMTQESSTGSIPKEEHGVFFNKYLLNERLAGNQELIHEAMDLFRMDLTEKIKFLEEKSISGMSADNLINLFHTIKGQAANLCFESLVRRAEFFERNATEGKTDVIEKELEDFISFLKQNLEFLNRQLYEQTQ